MRHISDLLFIFTGLFCLVLCEGWHTLCPNALLFISHRKDSWRSRNNRLKLLYRLSRKGRTSRERKTVCLSCFRRLDSSPNAEIVNTVFGFIYLKSALCLQEREKLVSLEGKYAELSEGQTFTNNPVAIKEVRVTGRKSTTMFLFPTGTASAPRLGPFGKIPIICFSFLWFLCSTCILWRKDEEAARKTHPTQMTVYLRRGASSSSPLMADPWDARFLPRSLLFSDSE